MYTPEQRTAIGELARVASLLREADQIQPSEIVRALADGIVRRAIGILKGETIPQVFSEEEVARFARFWDVLEPPRVKPYRLRN